ncbi:hypothetical protein HUN08_03640 [Gordonia sp. X0973]|uniref:hypothetical protein n=1 Tax=Gordonia sp. X0973 TaxID=2742602 RepID=UPI000F51F4A2|nr:hypothetical protein [Gordonia sp. X0973]QKT06382.1 hypothetical protein HUN08_03640 [Gordonia sp. X0973]
MPGSGAVRRLGVDHASELFDGRRIVGLRRVFFVYRDHVDETRGPIEFTLSDGAVVWMDTDSDWTTMWVYPGPWTDPFTAPLSAENAQWVADHGKWSDFPVGDDDPLAAVMGTRIDSVDALQDPLAGDRLVFHLSDGVTLTLVAREELVTEIAI